MEDRPEILSRGGHLIDYVSVRCGDVMPSRRDGAEVLYHEYGVQLRLVSEDIYVLNVLCGAVAQYGVEVALNVQEVQSYRSHGDKFIHDLGEQIFSAPERFESRIVRRC